MNMKWMMVIGMNKYINADELKSNIPNDCYPEEYSIEEIIDETPAADVVEVVRCKDCEHWKIKSNGYLQICIISDEDDFCAWGERKETE